MAGRRNRNKPLGVAVGMSNLTVAVIAPPGYAKDLGKKGTASDVTIYDVKRGEDTVSFIEPTKYPDRLAPLFYACSVADSALVVVDEVNSQFGECALMLDAIGLRHGQILLRNFISRDRVDPLIKGTVLESYRFIDEDFVSLRESYLDLAGNMDRGGGAGKGAVPIDHFFNVKGVGTVALGHVAQGTIRRHDDLMVLPGRGSAQVRSIQKHDDDFDTAAKGDRVGLALKGIDAEDLDRGHVLTDDDSLRQDSRVMAAAALVKYWPSPLREGMVVHLGHWMQFLPARVASVEEGPDWRRPRMELVLEKEIVHPPGSRGILCHLDGGKLRVMGRIDLP